LAASVKTSLKESIDVESRNALKSLATETSLNSTAGAFGGGMSGGTRGVFEWDSNKSVADNLKMVAAQTAMGAITGTTMAGGMTLGFKAIAAPASKGIQYLKTTSSTNIPEVRTTATVTADGNNALISADANPHIQGVKRKDGSIVELKQGEKITLEDGDTPITRTDDAGFPIDADGTPITDESAVDLNNNSDVFGYSQPPSESPQYKKGDLVSFGDDEYQVAGFDRNNGDVIIYQKGRGEETISPDVKEGELGTKYRIIRINGQNYFRDAAGNVYNKIDQGRAFALVPDNQYKVVPRDEIKFNAKPVKAPQSVKFSPDGFQDNKWHPAIYEVDDVQVELMPMSGWHWSGKRPGVNSNELGSVKIDVTAMNLDDAQKIQQYLLPLLDNDPAFAPPKMLSWKTLNPARGMAGGTEPLSAQDAKVFTLYCSNPADAIAIQKKLDQMIKEAGLGLDKPPQSGNVFRISGESNRVGIVRDTFTQSVDSQQWDPAINLDESLARSLENEFGNGQLLSKEQLERLINTVGMKKQEPPIIFYDSQGKLSMRVSAGRDGGHHDYSPYGVYVTEAGAGKVVGELTDRPALYSLYDRYRIDPVDEAVRLQRVNEVVTSKPSVPRASANGQKYETNKVSIIGRSSGSEIQIATTDGSVGVSSRHAAIYTDSAGNTYIADLGSTNGTYINDQKIASSSDTSKPNWVRINPGDKVTLGPTFDLNLGNPGPTGQ
ncbi:MAG: FHA domain-containing protein, partial [Candidatus Melainabacteria bacterium]|nr:FHA domain-containing protein [Candidatus Melainabacteria bacterium]